MTEIAATGPRRIKKFYTAVTIEARADAYAILLDGKPALTPRRSALAVPMRALAEAIVLEWRGEGEAVDLSAMRLTRLSATALDLAPIRREEWTAETARYAGFDLVGYRADAVAEAGLFERQENAFAPYCAWAQAEFGVAPQIRTGIAPAADEPLAASVKRRLDALDDWRLVAAWQASVVTGSAILGLGAALGAFAAEDAFDASRLDERWQEERWGVDTEAQTREARMRDDFLAAARFAALVSQS